MLLSIKNSIKFSKKQTNKKNKTNKQTNKKKNCHSDTKILSIFEFSEGGIQRGYEKQLTWKFKEFLKKCKRMATLVAVVLATGQLPLKLPET